MLDAPQNVSSIPKLYRKPALNISRLSVCPVEKAKDQLLLELHEK
jgi:hypothetical protein